MGSELLSYGEAAALVEAQAARLTACRLAETVPLAESLGRVLAQPLCADRDLPPFDRSTRDGFACRAAELSSGEFLPVAGATRAGEPAAGALPRRSVWEIMTGAAVPAGADAVAMIEHVEQAADGIRLEAGRNLAAGENIVGKGAEARAGQEVLAAGTRLGSAQIALVAACGFSQLEVFARPHVAILTTGDELVPVESQPGPGEIRNSNGSMLAALVTLAGGEPWILPAAADTAEALDAALAVAEEADLLLVTGGVSVGKFDLVEAALARRGAHFYFTGVRIQPGKPAVFGNLPCKREKSQESCFFGLPGNPISAAVTFLLFAAPVVAALAGQKADGRRFALAQLGRKVSGKPGLTRFVPAFCDFKAQWSDTPGTLPQVTPVGWQGSGDLVAFARSNCLLVVPEGANWLETGEIVRILLF